MAKLSAHGAELLRTDITYPVTPDGDFGSVDARRVVTSVRSDGAIMRKRYAHFVGDGDRGAYWHDWGWKLHQKYRKGVDLPAACEKRAVKVEALRPDHPDATITVQRFYALPAAA